MPKEDRGLSLDGQGSSLVVAGTDLPLPAEVLVVQQPARFRGLRQPGAEHRRVEEGTRRCPPPSRAELGFTGGEPMLRDDLEELVGHADRIGFYTNLITSGIGLTEERLLALKAAGLKHIQLSVQASRAELTDALVGARAHAGKMEAARLIEEARFPDGAQRAGLQAEHRRDRRDDRLGCRDGHRVHRIRQHPVLQLGADEPRRTDADAGPGARGGSRGATAGARSWATR